MDRNEGTPTQDQYDALSDAEREEFEAYLDSIEEPHFCESPSCTVEPGCAGYRSGYHGFDEDPREEALVADFERQLRASDDAR